MFFEPGTHAKTRIAIAIRCSEQPMAGRTFSWLEYEQAGHTQLSQPEHYPDPERSASIQYRFNSRGYRCPEFETRGDVHVLSVGCSETFGIGVPVHERFSSVFCSGLSRKLGLAVIDFNVALGAKSNDWIARTVHELQPVLRPDIVLCCFTYNGRREYRDGTGRVHDFLPGVPLKQVPANMRDVWTHLTWLASSHEDAANFRRNLVLARYAARQSRFLFSHLDDNILESDGVGQFRRLDVASDQIHRSTRSHRRLAEEFLRRT